MTLYGDGTSGGGGGGGGGKGFSFFGMNAFGTHGFFMWFAWTFFGLIQLISTRYMKHKYSWYKAIHTVSGILLLLTIISSFLIVFGALGWTLSFGTLHTVIG